MVKQWRFAVVAAAVGISIALTVCCRGLGLVANVITYATFLVSIVTWLGSGGRGWPREATTVALVLIVIGTSVASASLYYTAQNLKATVGKLESANKRLASSEQQLETMRDEALIRELIQKEVHLVGAGRGDVEACYTQDAEVINESRNPDGSSGKRIWTGVQNIHSRYEQAAQSWKQVSMHGSLEIRKINGSDALVTGITYFCRPGQSRRWVAGNHEVWRLHLAGGAWRISRFCYGIAEGDLDNVLSTL